MSLARRLAATRIGRCVLVPVLVVTATQILRSYLAPVIGPMTTPVQMFLRMDGAHVTNPVDIVELEALLVTLPDTRHPAPDTFTI